jgi:predicted transcriptional regulator
MPNTFFYTGIPSLNGTIVPDDIFDILLPVCTGAEFKVLAYVVRRTFGFKKDSDTISLKQMVEGITTKGGKVLDHGTGLSKSTVALAIKGLVEKGIIEVKRNSSKEKGDQPTTYRLRFGLKDPVSENRTGGVKKMDRGVSENRTHKKQ